MRDRLILILLLSFDLLTYGNELFGAVVFKSLYFSLLIILYFYDLGPRFKLGMLKTKQDSFFHLCMLFLLMYFFRMFYDLYFENVFHSIYSNKITYFIIFLNSVILPLFFLKSLSLKKLDFNKLGLSLMYILFFVLLFSFYRIITQGVDNILAGRASANENLDTISYGHLGLTLFFVSLSNYTNLKSNNFIRIVCIMFMLFGFFSMAMANSRSPIVALFFVILYFAFASGKKKVIILFISFILLVVYFINEINEVLISYGSLFVERIISSLTSNDLESVTSERTVLFNLGINEFFENPFLGSSFLIQSPYYRGAYYHNFIIESFASLGVFGGGLFCVLLLITLRKCYMLIRLNKKYYFFCFLFLQYFVFSLFSRSMVALPVFWISVFMVNNIYAFEQKNKNSYIQ
jgi:O-antigen ligase